MNLPEAYKRERKLQKLVIIVFPIAGIIGAAVVSEQWFYILVATGFCTFAFVLLHTAYLGIKYSVIELTIGLYSKEEKPLKYYLNIILFISGGICFLVSAYYV